MAHAAKINELVAALVSAVSGRNPGDADFKRTLNETTRALKGSTHARTNQFEVQSRLDGLVEKFYILDRDDLAEALQKRLDELPTKSKWTPEILSLLLSLSDRPVEKTSLESLDALEKAPEDQQLLQWDDLLADDPVYESEIWDDVNRGYHSSGDEATADDEDVTTSTAATSVEEEDVLALARRYVIQPDPTALDDVKAAHARLHQDSGQLAVSELTVMRETLLTLHRLPSDLYEINESTGQVTPKYKFSINTMAKSTFDDILTRCATLASSLNILRRWNKAAQQVAYVQSCQASVQEILTEFGQRLSRLEKFYVSPCSDTVVSIIQVQCEIETSANPLIHLSKLIERFQAQPDAESYTLLDLLYDEACIAQASGDEDLFLTFARVLIAGLRTYLRSVSEWMRTGLLSQLDETFFVVEANSDCELGKMWHERFAMRTSFHVRPSCPKIMHDIAGKTFELGKSRAFLLALEPNIDDENQGGCRRPPELASLQEQSFSNNLLPFSQSLSEALNQWMTSIASDCGPSLCRTLLHDHGLLDILDGLNHAFCSQDGEHFQSFADTLFWRMDAGRTWKDTFLLTELAQNTFGSAAFVDAGSLGIVLLEDKKQQNLPASSIAQLEDIGLEMILPWPVQNVTLSQSPAAYSKAFTFLLQVYRAKYLLRPQIFTIRTLASRPTRLLSAISLALRLRQSLLVVAGTLHAHITDTASELCAAMRKEIESASGIDEMADSWGKHHRLMEFSLLLSSNMQPIRDAVTGVLQLCEDFCQIWDSITNILENDGNRDDSVDSREEVKSPLTRLNELQSELDTAVSFIAAGLRAISRAGGNTSLAELAERLQWTSH